MNSLYREEEKDISTRIGERIISFFIGKYTKIRYRVWMLRKEANEGELNLQDLSRICSEHVVPVTSPLALISAVQGSGGTLLSQLFDGHSALHVHPHELMIGTTETSMWPQIDLGDGPERWFELLFEDIVSEYNRQGYSGEKEDKEAFPFVFISSLQREIFLNYFDSVRSTTTRDIFDGYMTSYFGAWLNNQNYYGLKKFIVAYTPRLGIIKQNMESFFNVYPDGRLISVIRNPKNWLPFVRILWPEKYEDVSLAANEWNESAQAMLWNKEQYGDKVCLIKVEDLLSKTEAVMRYLADFLGIEFDDILLVPTFNKLPIKLDRSLAPEDYGFADSPLTGARRSTAQELDTIEGTTSEKYSLVLKETVRFE